MVHRTYLKLGSMVAIVLLAGLFPTLAVALTAIIIVGLFMVYK